MPQKSESKENKLKISILIPCFNEEKTIAQIIDKILAVDLKHEKEIVVVDDGSFDETVNILETEIKPKVSQIVLHEKNKGKGAAINTGLKHITGDILIIQDADLEYDPADYPKLIEPIENHKADVVYGSRFLRDKYRPVFSYWHYMANKVLTIISNMFSDLNLTDMETCYKALNKRIYTHLEIKEKSFGVEPEITAKIAKLKASVYEVGISYQGRSVDQGKKITWKDGVSALRCILKYNLYSQ